jgi:hypothetical protein
VPSPTRPSASNREKLIPPLLKNSARVERACVRICQLAGKLPGKCESRTAFTLSLAATSALAEFPVRDWLSSRLRVPGAAKDDFHRTPRSRPVPARQTTSAICAQSCWRSVGPDLVPWSESCGFERVLTLFAAHCVWCARQTDTSCERFLRATATIESAPSLRCSRVPWVILNDDRRTLWTS